MIRFAINHFPPAAPPVFDIDDDARVAPANMTTVAAAWPVAVSDLAQKFLACQVREMRDRRG
jgi:hypothetical protein